MTGDIVRSVSYALLRPSLVTDVARRKCVVDALLFRL